MRAFLQTNISTIFIMLGHECNLNCKYCLQHDVVNVALDKEINPNIYNFINDVARSQDTPIALQFYGGEPLVFWNKIKEFIEGIRKNGVPDNVYFTMISNGKLMDEEKVKYINENFGGVTISWDGRNSKITRGYDVFEENKENIFKLNNFGISGVLSAYNYIEDYMEDCEALNKDYVENYGGHTISVNVDDLLDVNLENPDLKQFDFDKAYTQMSSICDQYYDFATGDAEINVIRKHFIEQRISMVKGAILSKSYKPLRNKCGNGCEVINLDLKGNLYFCHNTNDKVGCITDNYFDILKRVFDFDIVNKTANKCDECPVQIMCRNGCPLVKEQARGEYYCTMMNIMNYPIMQLVTMLGGEDNGVAENE
jgi:uncharacterized protein